MDLEGSRDWSFWFCESWRPASTRSWNWLGSVTGVRNMFDLFLENCLG